MDPLQTLWSILQIHSRGKTSRGTSKFVVKLAVKGLLVINNSFYYNLLKGNPVSTYALCQKCMHCKSYITLDLKDRTTKTGHDFLLDF